MWKWHRESGSYYFHPQICNEVIFDLDIVFDDFPCLDNVIYCFQTFQLNIQITRNCLFIWPHNEILDTEPSSEMLKW